MVLSALAIEISMNLIHFSQAKFLGAFLFGYVSHLVWHEHKPRTFLKNYYDKFFLPIAYGHIGGSLNLYAIDKNVIGVAFGLFILAEFVRFLVMGLTSFFRCYSLKEALFVSICWIPKGSATVTTAFSIGPAVEALMEEGDLKDKFRHFAVIM